MSRGFLGALATVFGLGCGEPDHRAQTMVEEGAVLLDVRTTVEFQQGHLRGALNIPLQHLEARVGELETSTPLVVYCRSGNRSATAARYLQGQGFEVYDMGPMTAWGVPDDIIR